MSALLLLAGLARAAAPDRVAHAWTVASPEDAALSVDGAQLALLGTGFTLLDLATWDTTAVSVCADARGLAAGTFDGADGFWVGCGDGTVQRIDVVGGVPTVASDALAVADTAITALEWDGTELYVVSAGESGLADVTAVTPADLTVAAGYPTTLSRDEVNDTLLLNGSIYVLHGSDDVTRLTTAGAGVLISLQATGADYQTATPTDAGMVYLTDAQGGDVWSFDTGSNGFTLHLPDVGSATTALCIDEDGGWAAVSADDDLVIQDFASGLFGDEAARLTGVGAYARLLTVDGGAIGIGTDASTVDFLSAAPWVEITSAPGTATSGDVAVAFTSDTDGEWTVWRGDTLSGATALDSGSIDAGGSASATLSLDSGDWVEGTNRVWVTVETGAHLTGHDAVDIRVDTPPPQPAITMGFGESTVNVEVAASDVADLDHYVVYLSDAPFTADDYPTGGPTFDDGSVTAPIEIDATPGAGASYTFYPLINGTTYYAAVRAVDAGGQVGPLSAVLSATPSYTYSASELRGDEGGFGCASAGREPAWIGLLVSFGALVGRRRGRARG